MGFLDILAGIGGGLEGGSRAAEALEKRKRERAEEQRVAEEYEREKAERLGLRKSLYGLAEAERADESDANAFELESGAQALDNQPHQGQYGEIDLPFAGTFKKAGDQIRAAGKQPSIFDPNIPYDKLITIQGQRRDARTRAGERRDALGRQQAEFDLRKKTAEQRVTELARKHGEETTMRATLKRLALARKVDVLPDEVDGMSIDDVQKLVARSAAGELGTNDYRDRRIIQVQMPTPKSGSAGDNNADLGTLNATITNLNNQIGKLYEGAPKIVKEALGVETLPVGTTADEIEAKVTEHIKSAFGEKTDYKERNAARVAARSSIARWLTGLRRAEQTLETATNRSAELVEGGVKRGTGGVAPPLEPLARPQSRPTPLPAGRSAAPPPPPSTDKAKEDRYRAARRAGKTHDEAVRIAEGG